MIDSVGLGTKGDAPYGAASGPEDESISRVLNGQNTGNDAFDFMHTVATPGEANHYAHSKGIRGYAIVFKDKEASVIVDEAPLLEFEGSFTIEMWLKVDSIESEANILTKYGLENENYSLGFHQGKLRFVLSDENTAASVKFDGQKEVADKEWHHIATVFDATKGQVILVIDGEIDQESTFSDRFFLGNGPFFIGANLDDNNAFLGALDELKIWKVARTLEEIRCGLNLTIDGGENGLVMYHQFEGGIVDVVSGTDGVLFSDILFVPSQVPVARGVTTCFNVTEQGSYKAGSNRGSYGLAVKFKKSVPQGVFTITYLDEFPYGDHPGGSGARSEGTWVIHNYGSNQNGLEADMIFYYPDEYLTSDDFSTYQLMKRGSNSYTDWTEINSVANHISIGDTNTVSFTEIDSFSQFVMLSRVSPLPLSLMHFEGENKDGGILLKWQSVDELKVEKYVGERSPCLNDFQSLDLQEPVEGGRYSCFDNKPLQGVGYYRIAMFDETGEVTYSHIISLNYDKQFTYFPNPFMQELLIEVDHKVSLEMFDENGNQVERRLIDEGELRLDTSLLASGVYVLKIVSERGVFCERLVKND